MTAVYYADLGIRSVHWVEACLKLVGVVLRRVVEDGAVDSKVVALNLDWFDRLTWFPHDSKTLIVDV